MISDINDFTLSYSATSPSGQDIPYQAHAQGPSPGPSGQHIYHQAPSQTPGSSGQPYHHPVV
jgi:hypothetical protein